MRTGGSSYLGSTQAPFSFVTQRVWGEFLEMPGLTLTTAQAERLFGLEPYQCQTVLRRLVDRGFLVCGAGEQYRRPSA
jgi:hypothetical protein